MSAQYLENCRIHNINCKDLKRGSRLGVTPEYFRGAHEAIFEIAVKLAHVLWRKLNPCDRKNADGQLLSTSYDLLAEEEYALAKTLLDFATEALKEYASESYRLRFVVNRIQAYKWSGDNGHALQLLKLEDFSASGDEFRLAAAVLRDDLDEAVRIVRRIGRDGPIKLGDYREWPLFRVLRTQPAFETAILQVFKQPLIEVRLVSDELQKEEPKLSTEATDS